MTDEPEFLTVKAAAESLGITRRRIWVMLKNGELEAIPNPLDRREKLIPRAEIDRLSRFVKKAAA